MPFIYDKLFALLKERGLTMYSLRKDKIIGTETLEKMRKGKGHIDTRSIESLCKYLNCQPGDLMEYVPDAQDYNKEGE
ncbi:MAG: helix-turn-helix transcriptional regulator [Clostridiales bacterium]|jgi:DNA-binding Xre family transcriptional regulator|nr:helix-turn-helix transcriptional regulator [Clostridiales bacterium]